MGRKYPNVDKDAIYIVISRTPTRIGKMIRKALGQEFNHVSLSMDYNLKYMYSFGRIMLKNPLIGGIIQESRRTLSLGTPRPVFVKIYRIPVTEDQYDLIWGKINDLFEDDEGYYYNYLGALGLMIKFKIKMYKTYICSEFALDMMKHAGIEITTRDSSLVTPEEISKLVAEYLIFDGNLQEYGDISENHKKREATPAVYRMQRQKAAKVFLKHESEGVIWDIPLILRFYAKLIRRDFRKKE